MAHPGGRPSKFSPKLLKKTQEYIDSCEDSYVARVIQMGDEQVVSKEMLKVKIPTLEGLALYLHVHKDTIQEWKKVHHKFSVLISQLLDKQAEALVNNGLSGLYNPTIAKVLLSKHGYREETKIEGEGFVPVPVIIRGKNDNTKNQGNNSAR